MTVALVIEGSDSELRTPSISPRQISRRQGARRVTRAIVLAATTAALDMAFLGPAASQVSSPRGEAPSTAILLEDMRPEVQAIGRQMYVMGVCEARIDRGEVDPPREIVAGDPADRKELVLRGYEIFTELYLKGRTQAAELNYDSAQCQRLLDAGAASIVSARLARRYR